MPFMCSGSMSFFKNKSNVSQVHSPATNGQVATKTSINKTSNCLCSNMISRFKYGQASKRLSEKRVSKNRAGSANPAMDSGRSKKVISDVLTPESLSPCRLTIRKVTSRTSTALAEIDTSKVSCNRCGQQFITMEEVDAHHMSQHAVTVLPEGGYTWSVIERICRLSLSESEPVGRWIQTVLKVNNLPKSILQFEDYRHKVQAKARKLSNPRPKLLADGNEQLRFHGTKVECSLSSKQYSTTCSSNTCSLCQILRFGFSRNKTSKEGKGIITTSSSRRALQLVDLSVGTLMTRKALVLCRVITGSVYASLDGHHHQEQPSPALKYDSFATNEELHLLNPAAVLPCFVIICRV